MHRSIPRLAAGFVLALILVGGFKWAPARLAPVSPSTPTGMPLEGITIEHLARTPMLPSADTPTSVGLQRISYQVGATLDLLYAGPVMYYVESGTLGLRLAGNGVSIIGPPAKATPSPADGPVARQVIGPPTSDSETLLPAGYAVYSQDGDLGPTRNASDQPLVVLAQLIVPEPIGGDSQTVEVTAFPQVPATPAT